MEERRPDPDQLLKRVEKEESREKFGKLKIYLGASPGVGKTHEMLQDALKEHKKGLDVVIGVVESHGRTEIEMLSKHFEMLPKKIIGYHGKQLSEFDLDLAISRYPGLILLDEMAHSNAPGLRHKKRWQDIKELLERGIDVYTTLNVQHIESLNDAVAQIIHAPIQESIPDFMLEMANSIELVDLSPDELLERLKEGKIYFPKQAELASEHFFRKGNLIALRELALRVMTDRVNADVLLYRQSQGIKSIWHTQEKFLVCVGPGLESLKLIRTAKRIANSLKVEWIAVYVDTPRIKMSEENRNRAMQHLRLAEQFGAETRILTGFDIVQTIMDFAHEKNITQIMIFKYVRNRWRDLFFRNLADEVLRYSGEIDVYVMTGSIEQVHKKHSLSFNKKSISWKSYGIAFAIIAFTTGINFLLFPFLSASNLIMIYLLGVTFVAVLGEIGPSILASVLSVLLYDFFFIPPYYSFAVSDVEYVFTLIVMLVVTQIISQLTLLLRRQEAIARRNENQTSVLYRLSQKLSHSRGTNELLHAGITYLSDIFKSEIIVLMPENGHLVIQAQKKGQRLNEKEQGVAEWVHEMGQRAGVGTNSLSFSKSLYLPLIGSHETLGVVKIYPENKECLLLPDQMQLLESCLNQIALALEVDRLQSGSAGSK